MTTMFEPLASRARLAELGLTVHQLHRVLERADAEAAQVSGLEPPTAEGTTRYNKTTRFLREELLPLGWTINNASNFCRTVDPTGSFAIATCSGDVFVGASLTGLSPSTQYPKGDVTAQVVQTNRQTAFDLGPMFRLVSEETTGNATVVWYLLYRVDGDRIACELSLPERIEEGYITGWIERIILPPLERTVQVPVAPAAQPPAEDVYDVSVVRRA